jgi:hypothetical protein
MTENHISCVENPNHRRGAENAGGAHKIHRGN